jgi:hypothetical protein
MNPAALVVLAADSEGNSYSPLYTLWAGAYAADSTWSGQMGLAELTDEDRAQGYSHADVVDGVPAVCLTPTN